VIKRKRLLVVTSTFPRWKDDDDPPFVFELCNRLKTDYHIYVLAPHFPGAKTEEKFDEIYVKRFRYFFEPFERLAYQGGILAKLKKSPLLCGLLPFFFMGEILALIKCLRHYRFHLIHAHWLIPQGLSALLACRLINFCTPLLCTSHGGDLFGLQGIMLNQLKRLVLTRATAVTVVSRAMLNEMRQIRVNHSKAHVIPMGVDLESRFVPSEKKKKNIPLLFVGRLVKKKGVQYLIDSLPLILAKHPQAHLVVVGDGPEKGNLKLRSVDLGISDHVYFLGAVKNKHLPALYQASDVVVFPSIMEGFGLVVVEALGCECATVTTDLPAMQDIIANGKTGLVVPQKNIRELADKIICLLDDPKLRRSLGREGRRFVLKNYDWNIIKQKYVDLIESMTSR
jgi:glycosyltransferase involved in cell wall biosynthesis